MEKPVTSTTLGIFDMDMSAYDEHEDSISTKESKNLPETAILDGEKGSWQFLKNSDDKRTLATVSFAEDWARHMQSRLSNGDALEAIWAESAHAARRDFISSDMKYLAVRILARHWEHREALQKAFDDYWHREGAERERMQNELLEDHLY